MANQVKFEIFTDKAGGFRWRLIAGNSEPVAVSESYVSRRGATEGAYRVTEIAGSAQVVQV